MRTRTLVIALLALFAGVTTQAQKTQAPAPAQAAGTEQQPPLTFKVEVNYVEIDAVVTDAQGNFARGLTKDDFEVIEDRKPQTVSVFSFVGLPVQRPDPPLFARTAIEPDVRTNRGEFNGRLFVLVLD